MGFDSSLICFYECLAQLVESPALNGGEDGDSNSSAFFFDTLYPLWIRIDWHNSNNSSGVCVDFELYLLYTKNDYLVFLCVCSLKGKAGDF